MREDLPLPRATVDVLLPWRRRNAHLGPKSGSGGAPARAVVLGAHAPLPAMTSASKRVT